MFNQTAVAGTSEKVQQEMPPWMAPFWKPAKKKAGILVYLVLIHILAVIGLILFPIPSIRVLGVSILLASLGGLGTTVGYHRLLAHRALQVSEPIKQLLIFWAMFGGSGHPASWVAYHRHHHSYTDMPEDVSSPKHGGFWWAHLRWLYQSKPSDCQKWCPELDRGVYKAWKFAEVPVLVLALFCGLAFGWQGFFWIGAIRLVYSLHMQCFVNSLTHLDYFQKGNSSKNVWWLGPLQLAAWGENWHRNHHSSVSSARLSWHWWQVDIGWYFICVLEAAGLATSVRRPSAVNAHAEET